MTEGSFSAIKKTYKEIVTAESKGNDASRIGPLVTSFFSKVAKYLESLMNSDGIIDVKGMKLSKVNRLAEFCDHLIEQGYSNFIKDVDPKIIISTIQFLTNDGFDKKIQVNLKDTTYRLINFIISNEDFMNSDRAKSFVQSFLKKEIKPIETKGTPNNEIKLFTFLLSLTKEEFSFWLNPLSDYFNNPDRNQPFPPEINFISKAAENKFNIFSKSHVALSFTEEIIRLFDVSEFSHLKICLSELCNQIITPDDILIQAITLFHRLVILSNEKDIVHVSCIRKIFQRCTSNSIKNGVLKFLSLLQQLNRNSERYKMNQGILFLYTLMLLYDSRCEDRKIWKMIITKDTAHQYFIPIMKFSIFVAVETFTEIFYINNEELQQIAASQTDKKSTKNTMGKVVAKFISNINSFFKTPWKYSLTINPLEKTKIKSFQNVNNDKYEFYSNLDFDSYNLKSFSLKCLKAGFGMYSPLMYSILILTYFDLLEGMPPKVRIGNPNCILQLFLGEGLKILSLYEYSDEIALTFYTVSILFSNVTVRMKLSNDIFAKWTEIIGHYSFCNDERKLFRDQSFNAICDSIELMLPGCELLIPIFINYINIFVVSQVYEYEPQVQKISSTFASAIIISNSEIGFSNELIKHLKNRKQSKDSPYYNQLISVDNKSIIETIIEFSNRLLSTSKQIHVFNAILRIVIELKENKELTTYLSSLIRYLQHDNIYDLYSLIQFAPNFTNFLPDFVSDLIKNGYLDLALEFLIGTSYCVDYHKDKIDELFCEKCTPELLTRFLGDYKRYPFPNGINFHQSNYDLFNVNGNEEKRDLFTFVSSRGDLIIGLQTKQEENQLSLMTALGNSSLNIKNYVHEKQFIPHSSPTFPEVNNTISLKFEPLQLEEYEIPFNKDCIFHEDEEEKVFELKLPETIKTFPIPSAIEQLGLFDDNSKSLTMDAQCYRESKALINTSYRYKHKIALLYVAKNQREQQQILGNNYFSPQFLSFATKLGYLIDMKTHCCTTGGLDAKSFSTGEVSLFYADSIHEVMFHVPSLLTSDLKNDPQFIYKKRHIGNDSVHIIWCEDNEEYKVKTIISHFNDAHIVIYPLACGMYHVKVSTKTDVNISVL